MEGYHSPVLLREVMDGLGIRSGKWYLDCTLGDGGHSLEILRLGGKVVGIDVDPEALERAEKRLQAAGYRQQEDFILVQGNFRDIKNLLKQKTDIQRSGFAGAIFDLGVSSLQLESPERGFSFVKEGPLDMRMDPALEVCALDLINVGGRKELDELFDGLGEEKYSRAVADALVLARKVGLSTRDLAGLVEKVYRKHGIRKRKIHPATKVFQALRIAVNDELNALETGLEEVNDLIENYGHIVLISFNSLEDRIVKNTFKAWEAVGLGRVLTKKPIRPGLEEVSDNPRSRSAKMRVFEIL